MRRAEALALRADAPFADVSELAQGLTLWLDAALSHAYAHGPAAGRDAEMRDFAGLLVLREQFERDVARAGDERALGQGEEAADIDEALRLRLQKTPDLPYARAVRTLELNAEEERALRFALAADLDEKYKKLFAFLQDDISRLRPSLRLAAFLCAPAGALTARAALRLGQSPRLAPLLEASALRRGELAPAPALVQALFGEEAANDAEEPFCPLHEEQTAALRRLVQQRRPVAALLCGPEGVGRRTALRRAGARLALCRPETLDDGIARAALHGTRLAVDCGAGEIPDLSALPPGLLPVFLLAQAGTALPPAAALPPGGGVKLDFAPPGDAERAALFALQAGARGVQGPAEELAEKFFFLPRRVKEAMAAARARQDSLGRALTAAELHSACYDVLRVSGQMAERAFPTGGLDDLVLPRAQKEQLRQAVEQVELRRRVYEEWGFGRGLSYGRGVSILLSGPPGTGKTMAASRLASALHMRLHTVQLSQVISKYVGETEKNLRRAFAEAAQASAVLFFDECDALFGKRAEVRDAQDRHANAEVAFLLKELEAHEGVTILATNLSKNLDPAFLRRMRFVVHFPFPDAAMRQALFRRLLPPDAPLEGEIDFAFLAEKFALSGGNIRNITLHAAFLAAAAGEKIGMKHLLRAAVYEQRKNEIVVVREDLRQYEDLLDS